MSEQRTVGEHFRIISELGSGGFGQTFLAENLRSPNAPPCVVKQLKPQSNDADYVKMSKRLFEQEVKTLYQLGEHPQIPSIITHFEQADEFFFVQEYIEGGTFAEEIARGTIFSQSQVIEIVGELLSVLAFVHSRDVIHRDIKPSNLIRRISDGKTVLIDFGAVKQVGNRPSNNPTQMTTGTVAIGSEGYMPMEQLAGHPRFSSDVYAVGMFAIQLLTQTHPSRFRQNQRTGEWIWQDKVMVGNQLAEFLNRMIRYDFRQRFTDAGEALAHLKRLSSNIKRTSESVSNRNQGNIGVSDAGLTQATFFTPDSFEPAIGGDDRNAKNPPFNAPAPPFLPQFEQELRPLPPNVQKYDRQPSFSPPEQSPAYPNTSPLTAFVGQRQPAAVSAKNTANITLGGSLFDIFTDSKVPKTLLYLAVFSIVPIMLSFFIARSIGHSSPSLPQAVLPSPAPVKKPVKNISKDGFKSVAMSKEQKATTSDDWYFVAKEWQKAEEYYSKAESLAVTEEDRSRARQDREFCAERKNVALQRSEKPNKKRY